MTRSSTFRFGLACAVGLTAIAASTPVDAATLDPTTGKLTFDAYASFSSGLDAPPSGFTITATDASGASVDPAVIASRFVADAASLEGQGAFFAGGAVHRTMIDLSSLAPKLGGRRVEVKIWQRPGGPSTRANRDGTFADIYLLWLNGLLQAGVTRFQATGRGTDDGWREYSSGAVDFAFGGSLSPTLLVSESQLVGTLLDPLSSFPTAGIDNDLDARVALDALEILDLGAPVASGAACTAATEATACLENGICVYGRCVDPASGIGSFPADPGLREAFVDRVRFEFRNYEGGRYGQTQMAAVDDVLASASTAINPITFWSTLGAIESLHDAHSSPPTAHHPQGIDPGICLGVGAADLLPETSTDPAIMVYQTDATKAPTLQAGDVLTAIDGMSVSEWIALRKRNFFLPGDPRASLPYAALLLANAASAAGSKLTFARCDRNSHSTTPCTADEVTTITVDLGALSASKIWNGTPGVADLTRTPCDPRFTHVVPGTATTNSYAYTFAGSVDLDASTRLLQINGVPDETETGGEDWKTAVTAAIATATTNFVLDEREGNGGSPTPAFPLLFGSFFSAAVPVRAELVPFLEGQSLVPTLSSARACYDAESKASDGYASYCDGYSQFVYADDTVSTFTKNNEATKLAIMGGMDVSGNDFLTRMILTRTGSSRFFSPVPTLGGYGVISFLPSYGVGLLGGSVQIHDTIFTTGNTDPSQTFESATGVTPDEVVLQKQSDAINGVDTLLARARAWLAGN